jgi:hypothetical protein
MAARIKVYGPTADHSEYEVREFPSFEEAREAFGEMYNEYPETVVISGIPRPEFRRGKLGDIVLVTDKPNPIERDRDGRLYLGASRGESEYVRGYGYMRLDPIWGKILEAIPDTAIEGHYTYGENVDIGSVIRGDLPSGCYDPVLIDGLVVEQADISRVVQESGKLPTHIYHMDHSGSVMYIQSINWGDVPAISGIPAQEAAP